MTRGCSRSRSCGPSILAAMVRSGRNLRAARGAHTSTCAHVPRRRRVAPCQVSTTHSKDGVLGRGVSRPLTTQPSGRDIRARNERFAQRAHDTQGLRGARDGRRGLVHSSEDREEKSANAWTRYTALTLLLILLGARTSAAGAAPSLTAQWCWSLSRCLCASKPALGIGYLCYMSRTEASQHRATGTCRSACARCRSAHCAARAAPCQRHARR